MSSNTYTFHQINECNFCKSSDYKVLGKRLNKSQGFNPKKKIGITISVLKCANCELIYANPQPVPQDIQDHYGVPPENYWKPSYFEIAENYFSDELKDLDQLGYPTNVALDIGAGLGNCMVVLDQNGFESHGIEPSASFHKIALEKMNIDAKRLQLSTIENAYYEKESFGFITFGAVLEHLYDPSLCIKKALKWIKPGGLIHIEVPNSNWLSNNLINLSYKLRGLDYAANISPMHTPYHLYEFSLKSFNKLAQLTGDFEIAHHRYYVCDTYLPRFLDPLLKPIMKKTKTGMQLVVWLRKK